MKLQWNTISTVLQRNLEQSLLERGNDFSTVEIAGFLKGSLGMNYRWDENEDMKEIIYNGIKRCYGDKKRYLTDPQGIANIIYSFGEMKFKWTDFPRDIKKCFYNGIEKNYSRFESQTVSNIIYGYEEFDFKNVVFKDFFFFLTRFGNLSVHYPSLPAPIRRGLSEAVYLSKESGNSQDCSMILLGLSHSQANWNDLEERVCEGIVERMRITFSGFNIQVMDVLVVSLFLFITVYFS
jgi:hypothetical protein